MKRKNSNQKIIAPNSTKKLGNQAVSAKIEKFTIVDVKGDGNCFYRAISLSLL